MKAALLDRNVLVALVWPSHVPWIIGHRQVIDTCLIGLADRNNGELVTLDHRLKNSVSSSRRDRFVSLIATG